MTRPTRKACATCGDEHPNTLQFFYKEHSYWNGNRYTYPGIRCIQCERLRRAERKRERAKNTPHIKPIVTNDGCRIVKDAAGYRVSTPIKDKCTSSLEAAEAVVEEYRENVRISNMFLLKRAQS